MLGVLAVMVVLGVLATACSKDRVPQPSPVPTIGPAWQAVLDQVRPDGTVTAQTALQAFALAFGPLPGVSVPPRDPGIIPSGTGALRWLVGHWKEITPQQRTAAVALVPELSGLPASGATAAGLAQSGQRATGSDEGDRWPSSLLGLTPGMDHGGRGRVSRRAPSIRMH